MEFTEESISYTKESEINELEETKDMTFSLDSLINLEESLMKEGHKHGFEKGREEGIEEGYQLGITKGNEIGTEIGYYKGCMISWTRLSKLFPDTFSTRALKSLEHLESLLSQCSSDLNPQNEELLNIVEKIRAKFKMVNSLFGRHFKVDDSLSF